MKNTMTDRCVVNKKLVRLIEQWREETLPKVVDTLKLKAKVEELKHEVQSLSEDLIEKIRLTIERP